MQILKDETIDCIHTKQRRKPHPDLWGTKQARHAKAKNLDYGLQRPRSGQVGRCFVDSEPSPLERVDHQTPPYLGQID